MRRSEQESVSVWQQRELPKPPLSPLSENTRADICIVGAGIVGLTTGYLLAKEGKAVAVIDAWGIAAGETGRTTAHLSAVLDDRFSHLESLFGEDGAKLAAQSHKDAIDRIEAIVKEEKIGCDFERVTGYLAALDEKQRKDFDKERDAVKRAGFPDMHLHDHMPVGDIQVRAPIMAFPQQATFDIDRYVTGLAEAFQRLGGHIHIGHVRTIKGGKQAYAETDDGFRITADHIVIATNTPINDRVAMHTKQAAYRTYVIAYRIPKNRYPGFLLWDMEDPYHYVRILRGAEYDTLIVGGEDHKTGQANDMEARYARLDAWTKRYFTSLGPIQARWSGQIMEPIDSLAFIGRNPMDDDNVFIATGDSGNGITHGTIAGMLITDLIQGRMNAYEELYDPARKKFKAAVEFIKENTNAVCHMAKDWVKPGEVANVEAILPGEGAILRRGAAKIAVYRDMEGQLHERSAVCTHLGCIVQWNSGEKSWDCPCHGSRFDCEGRILNGPAVKELATVEERIAPSKAAS